MKRLLAPLAVACTLHGGAAGAASPPLAPSPASAPGDDPALALRLLADLAPGPPAANTLLSPLGLRFAAALLLPAAQGPTRQELLAHFAPGATDGPAALASFAAQRNTLLADHSVGLQLVGGIWTSTDTPPAPAYVRRVREETGSTVQGLDFRDAATLSTINGWFARQTNGLVPSVLDQLPRDTGLVLGTALYFKGRWAAPFDPAATRPSPFTPAGAVAAVERPTMHRTFAALAYRETPAGQAVRLPFAGDTFELIVLLPRAAVAPAATATAIPPPAASLALPAPAELAAWLEPANYTPERVRLALPQARLEGTAELLVPLRRAGLATAFGPAGDYRALLADPSAMPVHAARVVQRVVLGIDEAGAEAAAATAVVGVRSMAVEPPARRVTVDHPYLLVLRHRPTGALLALAAVADPG